MLPRLFKTGASLEAFLRPPRRAGKRVGFVPTMGALHAGHLSLVRRARRECGAVVVSIFVNPTQFGRGEDFGRYPRTLKRDLELLAALKPDAVFAPGEAEMYPPEAATWVEVEGPLTRRLEGAFRPGHFRGVATVVAGLFLLVRPDRAYFGLKDYQQYLVVRKMVRDLHFPLKVVGCPTERERDGLALSSRNRYLDPEERRLAPLLHRSLERAGELLRREGLPVGEVLRRARAPLREGGFHIDYFSLVDPETLAGLKGPALPALAVAAVRLGRTRLIDNLLIR